MSPKYPLPLEPDGWMEVGEGSTSVNLDGGSLRDSLFQIPLPHGNELEPA
jgi:hypothetical protein